MPEGQIEIRPRSHAAIKEVQSAQEKPRQTKRLTGIKGKLGTVGLAILASKGAGDIVADTFKEQDGYSGRTPIGETASSRQETDLENSVEDKYGIEILDIREAYDRLGWEFNIYDENEFGNHIPTR